MYQLVFIGRDDSAKHLIQNFVNEVFPMEKTNAVHRVEFYTQWYERFFTGKHATLNHAVISTTGGLLVVDVDRLNANTYKRLKWWNSHKEGISLIARLVPNLVWNRIPDSLSMKPVRGEKIVKTEELSDTCRFFKDYTDILETHAEPCCDDHHGWAIDQRSGKLYQRVGHANWNVYLGL